ncbi:MAG: hypothetical protein LBV12_10245 [Puniceicoccales bacterium]|jgi:hypothetical protein|nr:hypothetical protein [Puniceicoccales bacterium]
MAQELTTTMTPLEIDRVLAPVAKALPSQADVILDIRAAARERRHPGACVRCFFQLAESAHRAEFLHSLRFWLEQNIQVVAHGVEKSGDAEEKTELERLPLVLENDTLESYCQDMVEKFHNDRVYSMSRVEMEFQYRE